MCIPECPHVTAMRAAYLDRIRKHKVYIGSLRQILRRDYPDSEKLEDIHAWFNRFAVALTDCVPVNPDMY